jgi:hypothetical protein
MAAAVVGVMMMIVMLAVPAAAVVVVAIVLVVAMVMGCDLRTKANGRVWRSIWLGDPWGTSALVVLDARGCRGICGG